MSDAAAHVESEVTEAGLGEAHVSQAWDDEAGEKRRFEFLRSIARNKWIAHTIAFLLFIGVWEAFIAISGIKPYLLPRPTDVAAETIDSFSLLLQNAWITLWESVAGFAIAAVVGVAIAILIVYLPLLRGIVMPYLVAFNAVPKVAFAPLLIIWLGLGIQSKIALSFLIAFFPIVVNTAAGMYEIEPNLINLTRLMKAKKRQQFVKIRIPHSLPGMFDGFKIALPIAIIGAIVGEFVASRDGLGHLIVAAGVQLNTELVFAAILVIAVGSMILYGLLAWVEARVLRWRPSAR
jgi:NitT/TauT family transport system permease protein